MAVFKRFNRMSLVKKVVCIALAIGTTVGSVFGVKAIVEKVKDDQKTIHPTFAVGGLIETNGEHDQNEKAAIYTKDAFSAKGLNIKLDFDSTVQYQVFFYNELDNFISCTEVYEKSADIVVPLEAYARIEVTPIWGEDAPLEKEIKWHEVTKYSKQLEIRVDKEQRLLESDFTAYKLTENKLFVLHDGKVASLTTGVLEDSSKNTYEFVVPEEYSKMYVRFPSDYVFSQQQVLQLKSGSDIKNLYPSDLQKSSIDNLIDVKKDDVLYFMYNPDVDDVSDLALMFCFL